MGEEIDWAAQSQPQNFWRRDPQLAYRIHQPPTPPVYIRALSLLLLAYILGSLGIRTQIFSLRIRRGCSHDFRRAEIPP